MIQRFVGKQTHVSAIIEEVLPNSGLVYLTDENEAGWTLTRSTPGINLAQLRPGQRGDLTVSDHGDFRIASGFTPLD